MKRPLVILTAVAVVILAGLAIVGPKKVLAPFGVNQNSDTKKFGFDKKRYSLSNPSSIWVVINKQRPLPRGFAPANLVNVGGGEFLRRDVSDAASALMRSAESTGVGLRTLSGYRSYDYQTGVYDSYVAKDGQAIADTYSARPGYSEHQTGLAIDLGNPDGSCDLEQCFGETAGGKWLAANAHKFGFIIRYQKGKENITGYQAEPWHLRYVGKVLAVELKKSNLTLEEFFGLPPAPNY